MPLLLWYTPVLMTVTPAWYYTPAQVSGVVDYVEDDDEAALLAWWDFIGGL